jgi:putative hydrolase of the HAD superfamily
VRRADLDAVTTDAYGTLLTLDDPVPRLAAALARHGVAREPAEVEPALAAEIAYYAEHKREGRDAESLAALRRDCAGVFLEAARAPVAAAEFVADFTDALAFRVLPGVAEALARLRELGLPLAVVSNWDCALGDHLERAGLGRFFAAVVGSAESGLEKPDPAIFALALERLGVEPGRALHVGDHPVLDEQAARAAGMQFAYVPLAGVVEALE